MRRILVTGAAGQLGSELIPALRERYGSDNVVAAMHRSPLTEEVADSGPFTQVDATEQDSVERAIRDYDIDSLYHLGSLLSVAAEANRPLAHRVNIIGLLNVLEAACDTGLERVVIPSSIAAFGIDTPHDSTPNETLQRPTSLYGISKVFGELMGNYFFERVGLDVRGVRLPGVISWKVEPGGGTTDYAVDAFYGAIREGRYTCYLRPGTYLPMMYVPDAIKALIEVAEADVDGLKHHADYNVNSNELRTRRACRSNPSAGTRLPDGLRRRPSAPVHRRLLAQLPRRHRGSPGMGLASRLRPRGHGRRHVREPLPQAARISRTMKYKGRR